jgi:sterol carrier protein 2
MPLTPDGRIEILAQSFVTDDPMLYKTKSAIELTGTEMTRRAAAEVFKKTGLSVDDVGVIELHDCFAANELLCYDALGLCKPGKAHDFVRAKDNT